MKTRNHSLGQWLRTLPFAMMCLCMFFAATGTTTASDQTDTQNSLYVADETMPEFPGGEAALMAFIRQNLKYPAYAMEHNIQGRVIVSFVVREDGSISKIKIVKSPHASLSQEAKRIVNKMPQWIPATQTGKKVAVRVSLPLTFKLS
ncbi:MAG: energy transducer TonB [Bacteroidales bacterium]|nr:energy transducer TonB [Bacteroidales bacterium]